MSVDIWDSSDGEKTAMQVSDELATVIAVWCGGHSVEEIDPFTNVAQAGVNVPTPEGVKRASRGDWVVKKDDKAFDVMGPNEFRHTYVE